VGTGVVMLSDNDTIRYARQVLLDAVGETGQNQLLSSSVLIVGAGGLGVPLATYLAAAGVGCIGLADSDTVEYTNLHRQVAYGPDDVGKSKTACLKKRLLENNPNVVVTEHPRLTKENAEQIMSAYDLVADGCDNYPTRFLVNAACVKTGTTLVATALSRFDGQIMAFNGGSPCYQCLVGNMPDQHTAQGCVDGGIVGPVAGMFGCWQALEIIKQLLKMSSRLTSQLLMVDVINNRNHSIKIKANPQCPVCGGR